MIELTLLLLAAAAAFGLARWMDVPVVPLLLAAGFALSVAGLAPQRDSVEEIVAAGVVFLVFAAGTQMTPARFAGQRGLVLWIGALQFLVLGALGVGLAMLLGFELAAAAYLGMAMAASSTLVVIRLLNFRQQLFEPFGRLVVGVLLLQDAAIIVLMVIAFHLDEGLAALGWALVGVALLAATALLSARLALPWLIERYGSRDEVLLLSMLALLFLFLGATQALDIPAVVGAFMAGVALSPFPARAFLSGLLDSLADIFLAIFFAALGALVVIPSVPMLLQALAFVAMVVIVTPVLVATIAERSGFSSRNAFESGLLLAQTSEFSLVVALQGLAVAAISETTFSVIVLVTVLTMVLTPMITANDVVVRLLRLHPRPPGPLPSASEPVELDDHVILIGRGTAGNMILEHLLASDQQVAVIDHDPAVVAELHNRGVPAVWGDATDARALAAAGADCARLIISTAPRLGDLPELASHAQRIPVYIHVFEPEAAERIQELGATPLVYTDYAADEFIRWFRAQFASNAQRG